MNYSKAALETKKFIHRYEKLYIHSTKDRENLMFTEDCVLTALRVWHDKFYRTDADQPKFNVIEIEKEHKDLRILSLKQTSTPQFKFKFTPDMVADINGEVWLFEYKSSAVADKDGTFEDKIAMDSQVNAYISYLEHILERKVSGVVYRRLIKPQIRKKKTETREDFRIRLLDFYKDPNNIEEFIVKADRNYLDCWVKDLHGIVSMIKKSYALNHFPKNTNNCIKFNIKCDYLEFCTKNKIGLQGYKVEKKYGY